MQTGDIINEREYDYVCELERLWSMVVDADLSPDFQCIHEQLGVIEDAHTRVMEESP